MPTPEEERIVSNIAAACKAFFYDGPNADIGRLRHMCVDLVRRGKCVVYTYVSDESHFWLEPRQEGRRHRCHYLADRPVHHGMEIEVWHDERWVRARYLAEYMGSERPDVVLDLQTSPRALIHLEHTDEVVIARWPRGY
jgi:hypothetical protein